MTDLKDTPLSALISSMTSLGPINNRHRADVMAELDRREQAWNWPLIPATKAEGFADAAFLDRKLTEARNESDTLRARLAEVELELKTASTDRELMRQASTQLTMLLAKAEKERDEARASLSHVNKALGYPVDVNKWDDAEAAGLMLVDAIRKSRERHDSAIEELRRVTLDRDAKKERADKADQARDAANAVNADMGSQMCRIRAALDSKPGTWRQMADSMLDVIDSLKAERDAAVRRAELLVGTFTSRNAIAKICGALGLASADTYEEDADAIIAAIDRLRDEAKAARKACPVDVSTLRLLRASGLFGNEIATLTARVEHYKRACITTSTEVTRVLGEALYGPNPDAWSTHTPEAIADEAAAEIATLRAENERMRGEIITYQDAHTTGTEIIDGLRAKVEALEANDDVIELIRVAIDPDEPRLSGSCRAMVDVWLGRVEAARVEGER